MAIGRISGPMLFSNLERQGIDLAFEGNLIYLDVTNSNVGINTSTPNADLQVVGVSNLASIKISGNTISSATGRVNLGAAENVVITGGGANYVLATDGGGSLHWSTVGALNPSFGNVNINNGITILDLNGNLDLSANGTGVIAAHSDFYTPNIYVSGNIVTGGNITAPWFLGNIEGDIGHFGNVFVNTNLYIGGGTILSDAYVRFQEVDIIGNELRSVSGNLLLSANLTADSNSVVRFTGTTAIDIPTGTTLERPLYPDQGYIRYNSDYGSVEWWTGESWVQGAQAIQQQLITPDGVHNTYTLLHESTAPSILVSINGTVQQAFSAYTVLHDQITFSELPLTTDIIDVRYLAAGVAAAVYTGGNISGASHILDTTSTSGVGTGALIVDGGVSIGGNLALGGRIFGDLIPAADNTYKIGSSVLRWKDIWAAGTTTLSGPVNVTGTIGVTGAVSATGDVSGSTLTGTITTAAQPNITQLGTITSGEWNGGDIGISYGGTGASSASGALNNLLPAGEQLGYVLTTGGPGNYYWAAGTGGGGGGGGGQLSGIFVESSRTYVTATLGQTVFHTTGNFTPGTGQLRVYQNGVRQYGSEYTEINGNTFTLSTATAAGDLIFAEIDGFNYLTVFASNVVYSPTGGIPLAANTVQLALDNVESRKVDRTGDTMTGALAITSNVQATSTGTGDLKIKGGVGIQNGNLYIGGSGGNAIIAIGNVTTIANLVAAANVYAGRVFSAGANVLIPTSNVSTTVASLGVGTLASGVGGEIRATNDIVAYYSDDRLKTRLGNIENALDKVKSLTGFHYQANELAQKLGYPVKLLSMKN